MPSDNGSAKPVEPSPRVLPPAWLMGNNLKITSHGKTTQIGKKGITDWKSVSQGAPVTTTTANAITGAAAAAITNAHVGVSESNHLPDISLPSCPGALSPTKNLKKKLTPMTNLTTSMHPNGTFSGTLDSNYFATPVSIHSSSFKLLLMVNLNVSFSGIHRHHCRKTMRRRRTPDNTMHLLVDP